MPHLPSDQDTFFQTTLRRFERDAKRRSRVDVAMRLLAASSCAVVAGIVGHWMGLPWWRWDVLVSDNATLVTFTFIAVIALTHRS